MHQFVSSEPSALIAWKRLATRVYRFLWFRLCVACCSDVVCLRVAVVVVLCVAHGVLYFKALFFVFLLLFADMGTSLIMLAASLCSAFRVACAAHGTVLEPYQVVDVRMEEGVDAATAALDSSILLARQDHRNLDRIKSLIAAQKAESAMLATTYDHVRSV